MTSQKEREIKLELAPDCLPDLKKIPLIHACKIAPKGTNEVSVYFDTDKQKLRKHGLLLRVRHSGNRFVQTIKATGNSGLLERDEWETAIADEQPDLSLARGTALEALLNGKLKRQLRPVFETRVRRAVYPLANGARAIALAIDRGKIDTGSKSVPLCEIELELERGNPAALFEVARELVRALPAQLALKSKSERGYQLIEGEQNSAVKAAPINLAAGLSTREGFQVIGRACLKQVIDNRPALIAGDPEGVHQMRVGLRRLRAAISLFRALLHDTQSAAIKSELKWLTGELGPARELEVLVQRVVEPVQNRHPHWQGFSVLLGELTKRREMALTQAQNVVTSARFRTLTLDTDAWLEIGDWTGPKDDLLRERGDIPVEIFAADQLALRFRKVRKRGNLLKELSAQERHKLRIQVKKLRYAVEFFGSLFSSQRSEKRREKFLGTLERLQDGLGELNDIAVHEDLISAMALRRRRSSLKRVFAAGLLTGREDARVEASMAVAAKASADLSAVKPFWR
jgi:inorganic triphosphatase YgiF